MTELENILAASLSSCLRWLENQEGVQILMALGNSRAKDIIEGAREAILAYDLETAKEERAYRFSQAPKKARRMRQ